MSPFVMGLAHAIAVMVVALSVLSVIWRLRARRPRPTPVPDDRIVQATHVPTGRCIMCMTVDGIRAMQEMGGRERPCLICGLEICEGDTVRCYTFAGFVAHERCGRSMKVELLPAIGGAA